MKYIAGVSGGPDSMALLDKYKKKITLVCHVNYNKRDTAIRDRKIVSDYCKKNKINLKILNVTDKIYKVYKKKSNNFQNIARLIRYDFFLKNAKKINCYNLLISHNLNDFVETGIMQIKRNSKALFYGIKKNSNYKDLNIIRPLLFKPKINLKKYCETHNVSYGIDESNFSDLYERNRIRKTIDKTSLKYFYKKILKHNKKNAKLNTKITKLYSA
jgi:tRNA(Ile)-lysidine synthase